MVRLRRSTTDHRRTADRHRPGAAVAAIGDRRCDSVRYRPATWWNALRPGTPSGCCPSNHGAGGSDALAEEAVLFDDVAAQSRGQADGSRPARLLYASDTGVPDAAMLTESRMLATTWYCWSSLSGTRTGHPGPPGSFDVPDDHRLAAACGRRDGRHRRDRNPSRAPQPT